MRETLRLRPNGFGSNLPTSPQFPIITSTNKITPPQGQSVTHDGSYCNGALPARLTCRPDSWMTTGSIDGMRDLERGSPPPPATERLLANDALMPSVKLTLY